MEKCTQAGVNIYNTRCMAVRRPRFIFECFDLLQPYLFVVLPSF